MQRHQPFAAAMFFDRDFARYNEDHDPDTGQFTGDGGGGGSDGTGVSTEVGKEKGGSSGGKGGSKAEGKGPSVSGASAGAKSGAYEGKSPRNDQGSGRLKGATIERVFSPTADHKAALESRGATPLTFNELGKGSGAVFRDAIEAAKGKYKAAVTVYSAEEYDNARTFLTSDGLSGFALKGDDIISVFKHPDSTASQSTASILALAVAEGGKRLDCFDTVLPNIYAREGFRAVARTAFDDNYQPPGWDKSLFKEFNGGSPDVVFMVHDDSASGYKSGDGKSYPSYDDATAAQIDAVKEKRSIRRFRSFAEAFAFNKYFDRYNENHDPDTGEFSSGGGSGGGGPSPDVSPAAVSAVEPKAGKSATDKVEKPHTEGLHNAPEPATESKGKTKPTDFEKDKVTLGSFKDHAASIEKFVDAWDSRVGETPAEFKSQFLGGVDATMAIDYLSNENEWSVTGKIKDGERTVGTYTRVIDWRSKTAASDYFQLDSRVTNKDTGKKLLAGNIAMYQKLGIEKVKVHANIDVGGYAWAKYGYVPTRASWADLSSHIMNKLDRNGGGGSSSGYRPESWDEIGSDEQDNIKDKYLRDTRDDYLQSEIESWRDNGQALDDSKYQLAQNYSWEDEWAGDAVVDYLEAHPEVPYDAVDILKSISVEEYNSGYEGRKDPEFSFDDSKLKEPKDAPPKEQMLLPGFKPDDLSTHLTQDARDGITGALTKAFNDKAEKEAEDMDPPDFSDSVADYQSESWDSMSDREKYKWADQNGYIEDVERDNDDDSDPVDIDEDEAQTLRDLAGSSDPKALWAIADSPKGKELLLGSDWYGEINLKDKETMDRFNAYVGKAKRAA